MASSALTDDQQKMVAHLLEIVGCSAEDALAHLQENAWNLEVAVNSVLAIQHAAAEAPPSSPPRQLPSSSSEDDNSSGGLVYRRATATGHTSSPTAPNNFSLEPQPWWSSFLSSIPRPVVAVAEIVLLPARYLISLVGTILKLVIPFWRRNPGLTHNSGLGPLADVESFITDFQQRYVSSATTTGSRIPPLYRGTYAAALREAQRDLRFLLVYIHSEDNPNADAFCRRVLIDPRFYNFVTESRLLVWACGISSQEGQRVAFATRTNAFPALTLIALKNGSMTIVLRVSGPRMADSVDEVVTSLQRMVEAESVGLAVERTKREQQAAGTAIRREQDQVYEESVRRDREAELARMQRDAAEKEQKRLAEAKLNAKEIRKSRVTEVLSSLVEPQHGDPDAFQLLVRLPTGAQLKRRFRSSDKLADVYDWVHASYWASPSHRQVSSELLQLAVSHPKRDLPKVASFRFGLTAEIIDDNERSSGPTLCDVEITQSQVLLAVEADDAEA